MATPERRGVLVKRDGLLDAADVIRIGLDLSNAVRVGPHVGLAGAQDHLRELSSRPAYLAPELLMGADPTDSSDVYALSVLLFHLLTGDYPVTGDTPEELLENHLRRHREPLCALRPSTPIRLAAVIERGLDPDPAARFLNAANFAEALRRLNSPPLDIQAPPERRPLLRIWTKSRQS